MVRIMAFELLPISNINSKEHKDVTTLTNVLLESCKKKVVITYHTIVVQIAIAKIRPGAINAFVTRVTKDCS